MDTVDTAGASRPAITSGSRNAAEAAFPRPARFEALPIGAIQPSHTQIQTMRRGRFDQASLQELAASIKRAGLAQPIVVRELPASTDFIRFELVAGERRWLASEIAGLDLIQAVVRDLNDDEVLELQLDENLQRDQLHPLEEATGYEEMRRTRNLSIDEVAGIVSKSKSWVYNRLKLLELAEAPKDALLDGTITASVALLIARIPSHELQLKAYARIVRGADATVVGEPMSHREALAFIQANYMQELRGVPFKLDDETLLPAAGTCLACPKRSGNLGDLFHDVKNPNVCIDLKCLQAKRDAHAVRERADLEAKGEIVITGTAARKIKPAIDAKLKGYVTPDEMVMVDGELKSYRDALGEALPPVEILEDPDTKALQPVLKLPAVKEALAKAGIVKGATRSYDAGAKKKLEDKARIESSVRFRLLAEIRAKPPAADDMLVIAQHMWAVLPFDAQKRLVESRNATQMAKTGSAIMDHISTFQKKIAAMKPGDLAILLRDIALVGQCHVSVTVKPDAKDLLATAKRLGIKEEKVREAVEKDLAAAVAPKKGGKK